MDEILTTKQAAKFLNMSEGYVRKLVRQGELLVIRKGRRYTRFAKSDLIAFLDRYTVRKETAR